MQNTKKLAELVQAFICAQSKDFDATVEELFKVLNDAFSRQTREATVDATRMVQRYRGDLSDLIDDMKEHFRQCFEGEYPGKVRRPVFELLEAAYTHGANSALEGVAFAKADDEPEVPLPVIRFGRKDTNALKTLINEAMFWIGEHYGDHIEKPLEKELASFFTDGMTREDLSWGIEEAMTGVVRRSRSYWNFFADHTATKMREIGRVSGYEQAGVKIVRVQAWIDDRTTEICRALNGQVISVRRLRQFTDNYLEASASKDKDAIKEAWPWLTESQGRKLQDPQAREEAVRDGKVGLPPYHARCRTITVAEFREVPAPG